MKQWQMWTLKHLLITGLMLALVIVLTACPPAVTVTLPETSPGNRAPVLSLVSLTSPAGGRLEQNTGSVSGSANFAISDPDNLVSSLDVSASSSDQAIVANASISALCADNGNCTLSFLISTGIVGTTTITVRVTDSAGNSAEQSFSLSVTAPSASMPVSLCAADGLESNDNVATAVFIGTDNAVIDSVVCDPTDTDFFLFRLSTAATVSVDIDASVNGSSLDSEISLLDDSGNLIAVNDDDGTSTDSLITKDLTPGDYFIQVSAFDADTSGDYALFVSARQGPDPCTGDSFEFNDNFNSATFLGVDNIATSSDICNAGDIDVFIFSMSTSGTVTIDIDAAVNGSAIDSELSLFDATGSLIARNDDDGATMDSRIVESLVAGDYFIQVSDFDGRNSGTYQLFVSTAMTTAACDADDLEFNDTIASAVFMGTDNASISSQICENADVDTFLFSLSSAATLTIDIDASENASGLDSDLRLFDSNGVLIASNDDDDTSTDSLIIEALSAGEYYIQVASFGANSNGSYDLFVFR